MDQILEDAYIEMVITWKEHTVAPVRIVRLPTSVGRESLVVREGVEIFLTFSKLIWLETRVMKF